jgi:hypothetical protein
MHFLNFGITPFYNHHVEAVSLFEVYHRILHDEPYFGGGGMGSVCTSASNHKDEEGKFANVEQTTDASQDQHLKVVARPASHVACWPHV